MIEISVLASPNSAESVTVLEVRGTRFYQISVIKLLITCTTLYGKKYHLNQRAFKISCSANSPNSDILDRTSATESNFEKTLKDL